jgi:hypothetical protein
VFDSIYLLKIKIDLKSPVQDEGMDLFQLAQYTDNYWISFSAITNLQVHKRDRRFLNELSNYCLNLPRALLRRIMSEVHRQQCLSQGQSSR